MLSPPLVLWQSPELTRGAGEDTRSQAEAARDLGCPVHPLPETIDDPDAARAALDSLVPAASPTWAVWVGFFTAPDAYAAVEAQLAARGYRLINTLEAHLDTLEMDRALPLLAELTPTSATVTSLDELPGAVEAVGGYPVFVKGALKSRKEMGWGACVSSDLSSLEENARPLLGWDQIARGRVIVRALAPIIRRPVGDRDFLVSKEFRVFLLDDQVLAHAFYWPYLLDGFWPLSDEEERGMLDLARNAARRLPAPYVTIDVAMLEDGSWIVVEPGDAQVSGLNLVSPRELWSRLVPALRERPLPTS